MMKLDRFKLLFIHLPDFQLRNVPKRQLYPPHLTVYKIAHIFKGTALSNVAFTFSLLKKKKIKIKPSADEICSQLNLSSFLFEICLRLFKQKREIKTKSAFICEYAAQRHNKKKEYSTWQKRQFGKYYYSLTIQNTFQMLRAPFVFFFLGISGTSKA